MEIRVADYIAGQFAEMGITHVFLLSGGGMMHLQDGLARNDKLKLIYHHHEQCAGIAAESYARKSGNFGVSFATAGPGALNIVMPVANAWYDSSPVVFITGQSKKSQTIRHTHIQGLRQFGTFEVDIINLVKTITKFTWFLDKPSDTPYILAKAVETAKSGRPGPVLIDIPIDTQGAYFDLDTARKYQKSKHRSAPDPEAIDRILSKWKTSKRPLILAGHGVRVADMTKQLEKLVHATNTRMITTQLGKDVISYDDRFFIGHPGLKGDRAGNFAIQNADFILCIGSSLHVMTTGYEMDKFAPDAYIARIDLDEAVFDKEEVNVSARCFSDIESFIAAIMDRIDTDDFLRFADCNWNNWLQSNKTRFAVLNEPHKTEAERMNIYHVIDAVQKKSTGTETIVTDAGSAFYTIGQSWKIKGTQRVITTGGLGAMGWALPAATGASMVDVESTVLCFTGDGSLYTNIHELAVISKHQCNIKILIFNNNGYLSIKNTQDNYFNGLYSGINELSGVFLAPIDQLCNAYKIRYSLVNNSVDLNSVLDEQLPQKGPCLIEVSCNINQEIIPTVSSKRMDDGTMKSMPLDNMYPFINERELTELLDQQR